MTICPVSECENEGYIGVWNSTELLCGKHRFAKVRVTMYCGYCGNALTDEELVLGRYHEGCADPERREDAAKGGGGTYE